MEASAQGRRAALEPLSAELWLGWLLAPVLISGLGYRWVLPDRPDYLGHFLAGWAGSLAACWLAAVLSGGRPGAVLAALAGCLLLEALAEATVFALAGWDGIDFSAQSLGAAQASLGVLATRAGHPEADPPDDHIPFTWNLRGAVLLAAAGFGLLVGAGFAFA